MQTDVTNSASRRNPGDSFPFDSLICTTLLDST